MLYRYNPHLPKDARLLPIDTKIDINDALIDKRLQVSTGMITTFKRFFEPDKLYVEHGIKKKIAGKVATAKTTIQTIDSGRKVTSVYINGKLVFNNYVHRAPMVQVDPTELFNGGRYPGGYGIDYKRLIDGTGRTLNFLGDNVIPTRGKFGGATKGTSIASQYLSQTHWGQKSTPQWLLKRLPNTIGLYKDMSLPIRTKNLGRLVGRSVPIVGFGIRAGLSVYNISVAVNKPEALTVEAGGWMGAWAASSATGSALTATGIDLTGPWGWLVHGVITVGAGISGFYGGQAVGQSLYDKTQK